MRPRLLPIPIERTPAPERLATAGELDLLRQVQALHARLAVLEARVLPADVLASQAETGALCRRCDAQRERTRRLEARVQALELYAPGLAPRESEVAS
jgi:hypothetical protein